jgi:hypothetical protein
MTTELIIRQREKLARYALNETAKELKSLALDNSAMIGRVANAEENEKAVEVQRELKRVINLLEKDRKAAKEPLIDAGRQLDNMIEAEKKELDVELGRVSELVSGFAVAEQERIREERRAQQAELDRIEMEKQAEMKRIADEAAAKEAEAAKIKDASEREARLAAIAAEGQTKVAAVAEKAADQAYVTAKPILTTRAEGQRIKTDWQIEVVNPHKLASCHPDCVTITPKLLEIKRYLNDGVDVKGITAKKVTVAGVSVGRPREAIEV